MISKKPIGLLAENAERSNSYTLVYEAFKAAALLLCSMSAYPKSRFVGGF